MNKASSHSQLPTLTGQNYPVFHHIQWKQLRSPWKFYLICFFPMQILLQLATSVLWIGVSLFFCVMGIREEGKSELKLQTSSEWHMKGEKCSKRNNPNVFLFKNTPLTIQNDMAAISYHGKTDNWSQINLALNKEKGLSHWPDDVRKNTGVTEYMSYVLCLQNRIKGQTKILYSMW